MALHSSKLSFYSFKIFTLMRILIRIRFLFLIHGSRPAFHSDVDPDPASQNDADPEYAPLQIRT
jgi:hypothetical protein